MLQHGGSSKHLGGTAKNMTAQNRLIHRCTFDVDANAALQSRHTFYLSKLRGTARCGMELRAGSGEKKEHT